MIRRIAIVALIVGLITVAVLYIARRSIADDAIASALSKAGVPARYKVAEIGFGWQRLENISLGDPVRPDLTADWAEVRLIAGWNGITADAIRAGGVRLRGRMMDGKVSWGALDKLLPKSTGGPFTLPAIDVTLSDARVGLATPWGQIGAKLEGRGALNDGFTGKLAAVMPQAIIGDCAVAQATAYVDLSIRRGSPAIKGPVRGQSIACSGVTVSSPRALADVVLGPTLDSWRGTIAPEADRLTTAGGSATALRGTVAFSGTAQRTQGNLSLSAMRALIGGTQVEALGTDARFALAAGAIDARGSARAGRVALSPNFVRQIAGFGGAAKGTPVAPLLDAVTTATARAGQGGAVNGDYSVTSRAGVFIATVSNAQVTTTSGARLRVTGGQGIGFDGRALTADTRITLSGGGFPSITSDFRRSVNGESGGTARVAVFAAGDARLSLTPVQFLVRSDGAARVSTVATLDGPVSGGRIEGLQTPVVVARLRDGSIIANPGCAPLAFSRVAVQGLTFGSTSLGICSEGPMLLRYADGRLTGGAIASAARLNGSIGKTPLALSATRARIGFGDGGIAISGLAARLGSGGSVSELDIGLLNGALRNGGIAGTFAGLSGKIGRVPLLISGGAGDWRFAGGALDLAAVARVSDSETVPRFNTLTADALELRLVDNRIVATAILREPTTATQIAAVDLSHNLGSGAGRATLAVTELRFSDRFQPEMLTPLTLGVVANVKGTIDGRAEIDWDPRGATSTGRFRTTRLDFAAAFGPVDGAAGEIVFTDLLGLVTAPDQTVTLASVNPGVPVLGGRVTYRVIAGQRIVVEGGAWPFAGGQLLLEPTVLDMGEAQERRLTFRVVGLDAGKFIETLQFDNLAATGLFDGTIPMIFDGEGGRIEGGKILARPGGGTLAYVGEISNTQMNVYAKMAFDALKAIRYNNLAIGLDGPLDGEMVSTVNFRGINQDPAAKPKGIVARAIKGLPFRFNIVIRAPFRSLLTTARDLQDPSALIRRSTPLPASPGAQPVQQNPVQQNPVQPAESEKR